MRLLDKGKEPAQCSFDIRPACPPEHTLELTILEYFLFGYSPFSSPKGARLRASALAVLGAVPSLRIGEPPLPRPMAFVSVLFCLFPAGLRYLAHRRMALLKGEY